jgi:L-malate glycosyltransferase
MRILFVSTVSNWGGSEYLWTLMAEEALKDGHSVEIVASYLMSSEPNIARLKTQGATIHYRRELSRFIIVKKLQFLARRKMPSLFGYYKYISFKEINSAIISQGGSYEFCFDVDLFERISKFHIPYYLINQYHSESGKLEPFLYKRAREIFPSAKKLFFVSERNRIICETFLSKDLPNSVVINNPLRIKNDNPLPYPDDRVISFACVARLDVSVKCQNLLIKVLAGDKWRSRKWKLDFFGSGPDLQYLEELVVSLRLGDRIAFRGYIGDIQSVWANHHILLLPSAGEGCALSLIEAFGYGRTAVVTDVGGHEDLVIDGKTGFLAESHCIKHFDNALERAWNLKHQWPMMGVNGFNHLRQVFDLSVEKNLMRKISQQKE